MKALVLVFVVLVSKPAFSDLYLIQSRNISDTYGTAVGNILKRENPHWNISTLNLRDFSLDRYSQSDLLVAQGLTDRIDSFSNLVVLGHELSDLNFQEYEGYVSLPSLIGANSEGAATPSAIMAISQLVRQHVPQIRPNYYLISDTSDFSQTRLREFSRIANERSVSLTTYDVSRTTELRSALLDIENSNYSGVIINNTFRIVDGDSFSVIYSDQVDEIITQINTKHVEIGTLKAGQTLAVGVGVGSETVASLIMDVIEGKEIIALPIEIGINLERISKLQLTRFVLRAGDRISYVETDVNE